MMVAADCPADPMAMTVPAHRPANATDMVMAAYAMMVMAARVMVVTRVALGLGRLGRQAVDADGEDRGKGKFQNPHRFTPAPSNWPSSAGPTTRGRTNTPSMTIARNPGKRAQAQVVRGLLHWPPGDSHPTRPSTRTCAQPPEQPISVASLLAALRVAMTRLRLDGPA